MMDKDKSGELFIKRTLELARRAADGVFAPGDFLSPKEIHDADAALLKNGYRGTYSFYGGYGDAERRRLYCFPDYMLWEDAQSAAVTASNDDISVLRVDGSGYRTLSHRDFMGSVLALGIKRTVVGDIIVDENSSDKNKSENESSGNGGAPGAYIFCDRDIAGYLKENLTRIGSDAVKVRVLSLSELPDGFSANRKTEPISDTVASMRADCVIAALVNCPRERAKAIIIQGLADVNYETLYKPDAELSAGDIVSVRGEGKFRITGTDGVTRRGRLRLSAQKYI